MTYTVFQDRIARINDVLCTVNLVGWDARTMLPPSGGVKARVQQIATLGLPLSGRVWTGMAKTLILCSPSAVQPPQRIHKMNPSRDLPINKASIRP